MWTNWTDLVGTVSETLRGCAIHVPGLAHLATAPYLFRPFLLLILLSIVAGFVGTIINLRQAEFSAETMVHSVFPGIVAGVIAAGIPGIAIGGSIAAAATALALTALAQRQSRMHKQQSHGGAHLPEAATAVVLTSFYSAGVVLSLRKGDKSGQLEALMFGRLLEFSDARLAESVAICAVALVVIALTWPAQVAFAFDPTSARLQGIKPVLVNLALNTAIAATVVAAAAAIGVLLAVGFLAVPGAAARLVARTTRQMVIVAVAVTIVGSYLGMSAMLLPTTHAISPQASVTFGILAMYLVALVWRTIRENIGGAHV